MSRYVAPARPQPYGAIYVAPEPEPPQEPDMTAADAAARAAYPAPSDIVQGALGVFRAHLLERDQIAPDLMTAGALRYFFQHYGPAMAAQQVLSGIPGTAEAWGHYSVVAVTAAKAAYDREQRPAPPAPPQTLHGPIGVSGRDFVVPDA